MNMHSPALATLAASGEAAVIWSCPLTTLTIAPKTSTFCPFPGHDVGPSLSFTKYDFDKRNELYPPHAEAE